MPWLLNSRVTMAAMPTDSRISTENTMVPICAVIPDPAPSRTWVRIADTVPMTSASAARKPMVANARSVPEVNRPPAAKTWVLSLMVSSVWSVVRRRNGDGVGFGGLREQVDGGDHPGATVVLDGQRII